MAHKNVDYDPESLRYPEQKITEMGWYDQSQITVQPSPLTVTCLPTRHFSNRLFGANQTLWASFMLDFNGRKVYIGGDGGYDDRFARIRQRFGEVDLAIMENGQYNTNRQALRWSGFASPEIPNIAQIGHAVSNGLTTVDD